MTKFEADLPAPRAELATLLAVTPQAIHQFIRQGWFPLDRAKTIATRYDVPLRGLVRPDVREAIDAATAAQ